MKGFVGWLSTEISDDNNDTTMSDFRFYDSSKVGLLKAMESE